MKKVLLIMLCLGAYFTGFSQYQLEKVQKVNSALKNTAFKTTIQSSNIDMNFTIQSTPELAGPRNISENEIGTTMYDLQSNNATDHRIRLFPDGSVGAAWTMGTPPFSNRGTGYNYKDASGNWGPAPTARIEGSHTGWGSYAALGNGEIVVAHGSVGASLGLHVSKRDVKGTGTWTTTQVVPPAGIEYVWPRVCVNNGVIHVLANTYEEYEGMIQTIVYLRSTDGGATWSEPTTLPGLGVDDGFALISADVYTWAEPVGNTIAFAIGATWSDIVIMKSTDNGTNWNKIVAYEHPSPFPMYQDTPVVTDTIVNCDGSISIDLDNFGNAHITFGTLTVLYDDVSSEGYSYFPVSGYVGYWNETLPTLTTLEDEELWNLGLYIGSVLDLDNSGTILDNLTDAAEIARYFRGLASFPTMMIDDNGVIWVVYSAINELEYGGSMSYSQFFRNLYLTYSYDGVDWSGIYFLTDPQQDVMYEGMECIFPALSKTSNNCLHLIFQRDDEPGLHIMGDEDPATVNDYVYLEICDMLSGIIKPQAHIITNILSVYPNPATTSATVMVKSERNQTANILVTNILGQVVINETQNVVAGNNTLNLNVENLASGPYMIKVNVGNRSESQMLMID